MIYLLYKQTPGHLLLTRIFIQDWMNDYIHFNGGQNNFSIPKLGIWLLADSL